jgi:hypothetical protein
MRAFSNNINAASRAVAVVSFLRGFLLALSGLLQASLRKTIIKSAGEK